MRTHTYILMLALAAATLLPSVAGAQPAGRVDPRLIPGSRARQLLLKQALEKHLSGTLVAELDYNKKLWGSMSPEQLRDLREKYYAFLRLDDAKQEKLLKAAPEFERLTDRQRRLYGERAAWLKRVVSSLSPAEREELKNLTPAERAKRLLELRDEEPTSASPAPPTSRAALRPLSAPTR